MEISNPNELLRLFIEHNIRELPVCEQGRVTGRIEKKEVVRYLSRAENFEMTASKTITEVMSPADEDLLERMRDRLKEGEIKGIPVVNREAEVERTITPSRLESEESSAEYLEQTDQLDSVIQLLNRAPFKLSLAVDETSFETGSLDPKDGDFEISENSLSWETREGQGSIELPEPIGRLLGGLISVQRNQSIDLRDLIDQLEKILLETAQKNHETKSDAAESLGIPRQTFNYRLKKLREEDED